MKKIIVFLIMSLISYSLAANSNIGFKFNGLSIHPKGVYDNYYLMPNRLDKHAYFVLTLGGIISYEKFVYKDIYAIKIAQGLHADCAARFAGFSHIGVKIRLLNKNRNSLFMSFGPLYLFRRNWLELDGYINSNIFNGCEHDKWQTLFLWYGGAFSYKYDINDRLDFNATFAPGYPVLMNLSFGMKYKFGKKKRINQYSKFC